MISSDDILAQMGELQYEPTRIQGMIMDNIDEVSDGGQLMVDPSLPFPHLMEMNVLLSCAGIQEDQILNRRQYSVMSQDSADLFYHLSDVDFEGMFASPGNGWFYIYIAKEEVLQKAVKVGDTTTRKLTLPKHSTVVVNNTMFTFQYPINIIVKAHGGIDVVYDGSHPSPLQSLMGNKVDWDTVKLAAVTDSQVSGEFLRLRIKLNQMILTSYTESLSNARILKKTVNLTDSFYYCRAFWKSSTGEWVEMKTTHSQQVFDPNDPTLLLQVIDNELTYELPYVYYSTSLVSRTLRVDVYTTKGPINMNLSGLDPTAFVGTWKDLDNDDNGIYAAPLANMNTISIFSDDTATGGAAAPTFEQRRKRVLENAVGDPVIPISDAQMGTALAELGFDDLMSIDLVTERVYLTTRPMPDNVDGRASTGIDAAVMTAKMTLEDLLAFSTVIDNGNRVTVTPKTLYRNLEGVLVLCTDAEREGIDRLVGEAKANRLSDGTYLWSPLHYVLEVANGEFLVRPYYMAQPTVNVASYSASNDTLGLTISSSQTRSIVQTDTGYTVQIVSSSNDVWKALADDQVHVQLCFSPTGESKLAVLNGTLIGKTPANERIYEFQIETNWDLDQTHQLTIKNFTMNDMTVRDFHTVLSSNWSLIWAVSNYDVNGMETSEIDQVMGKWALPDDAIGVYHELLETKLGDELTGLWARGRSMIGDQKYVTWGEDVPAVYLKNVYEIDPITGQPAIIDNDGRKELVIEHYKGDPILNMDGSPTIAHYATDAMLDEFGKPIPLGPRTVQRWWDMTLFDGVYRYVTNVDDKAYAVEAPNVMVDWINDLLAPIRQAVIERTKLYFQPRNTLKYVDVLVDDGDTKTIPAAQRLKIDYYVSKEVYEDSELRAALESSAIAQVVSYLNNLVVSTQALEDVIRSTAGTDIVSVEVSNLGGISNNFKVITLLDESARLCVAKQLTYDADGTYGVVDAIEVNFKRHSTAV